MANECIFDVFFFVIPARNATPRVKKLNLSDINSSLLAKPAHRPLTARPPSSRPPAAGFGTGKSRRDLLRMDTARALHR